MAKPTPPPPAPAFCTVCRTALKEYRNQVAATFDPITGAVATPAREHVYRSCPLFPFHPTWVRTDSGSWSAQ